jgi:hypothetical protein
MENMEEKKESGNYVKELWSTFEKTGSIGAYLLYNTVRDKSEKTRKTKDRSSIQK